MDYMSPLPSPLVKWNQIILDTRATILHQRSNDQAVEYSTAFPPLAHKIQQFPPINMLTENIQTNLVADSSGRG